ncbi:MAG: hypothetical protein JWP06_642 [Candidatus Saccharibacteria bacterium]|nr:hypothetical protein [Candidatus Saccharibacteria bacterium]
MSKLIALDDFEKMINRGSLPAFILSLPIQKGMVGATSRYKLVINTSDHRPPHIHISLHDKQIAKYDLTTGKPLSSTSSKLDKIFIDWYSDNEHRSKAINEWERAHGSIN